MISFLTKQFMCVKYASRSLNCMCHAPIWRNHLLAIHTCVTAATIHLLNASFAFSMSILAIYATTLWCAMHCTILDCVWSWAQYTLFSLWGARESTWKKLLTYRSCSHLNLLISSHKKYALPYFPLITFSACFLSIGHFLWDNKNLFRFVFKIYNIFYSYYEMDNKSTQYVVETTIPNIQG